MTKSTRSDLSPEMKALDAELSRAFDWWNKRYWGGELIRPVFAYHPNNPRGKALGHFRPGSWVLEKGRRSRVADEIVFYSDLCFKAGVRETIHTLVHEMAHLWQSMFGKLPARGNYHNKEWHQEVARLGLLSDSKDETGNTRDGPGFLADLKAFKPRVVAIPFRVNPSAHGVVGVAGVGGAKGGGSKGGAGEGGGADGGKKKNPTIKWVCGCGFAVWVAVPYFNANCKTCGKDFEPAVNVGGKG